ncbi:MAG TPA: glycoside hydrolase family 20 zincin-like fold domain-containing protein [Myxococcota bacterium]|nr:glycoside hydrolase family 20 zincin-like fold domain-containing protein [Myxococcota bacterium]
MKGQLHLLPRPRELEFAPGVCVLDRAPEVAQRGARAVTVARARERVAGLRTRVALRIDPAQATGAEGFELAITPDGAEVSGRDARGLNWGVSALLQIARQRESQLPCLHMRDWPELAERGYMLDVSRDRVPTMATVAELVDLCESLRLNQLQLYTEHTFAYRDHAEVWRDASPFTPDEIRTIDGWCAARGIELVPNQNGFGHMERWLRHPRYAPLAELGEGAPGPGSTLAPTPEAVAFVRSLYAELLPSFSSHKVNIGCDEPFELGRGRSKERCEREGKGRVYLNYVSQLISGLQAEGRTVQLWGDIIGQHPELIPELPRERLVALAWGYEAPIDPAEIPRNIWDSLVALGVDVEAIRGFAVQARRYQRAGVPFTVCPGTSSWLSLVGRVPNALGNVSDAARAAREFGARGMLITDWGDLGHLQPPVVSLPGLCLGAALAWASESQGELDLFGAIDALVVRDATGTIGAALARLGELYLRTGIRALNSSPLAMALLRPFRRYEPTWGRTDRARLDAIVDEIDRTRAELARAAPQGFGGRIVARELSQAAALARHGAFRLMHACLHEGPPAELLRRELGQAIDEQRACWLARSREGGLRDSLGRLEHARAEYGA